MSEQSKISYHKADIEQYPYVISITSFHEYWERFAIAIEKFGFPAEKYVVKFGNKATKFCFKEEQDAIMFELMCG